MTQRNEKQWIGSIYLPGYRDLSSGHCEDIKQSDDNNLGPRTTMKRRAI